MLKSDHLIKPAEKKEAQEKKLENLCPYCQKIIKELIFLYKKTESRFFKAMQLIIQANLDAHEFLEAERAEEMLRYIEDYKKTAMQREVDEHWAYIRDHFPEKMSRIEMEVNGRPLNWKVYLLRKKVLKLKKIWKVKMDAKFSKKSIELFKQLREGLEREAYLKILRVLEKNEGFYSAQEKIEFLKYCRESYEDEDEDLLEFWLFLHTSA